MSSSSADVARTSEREDPPEHPTDPTSSSTRRNEDDHSGGAAPPQKKKRSSCSSANHSPTPITQDGERPQKKFYRQRAHCNPLSHNDSYEYPVSPRHMQWTNPETGWFYPPPAAPASVITTAESEESHVHPTVLDIGCGFGGLLMSLATVLPHERILGLEIRAKVTEFVRLRIVAARNEGMTHRNAAVIRTNTMKFLVNYFAKASLHKLFICFPDPHFKRKNHPRRILTTRLLDEYAFVLSTKNAGKLYCITDVAELHEWHVAHCDAHPLFRRVVVGTTGKTTTNKNTSPDNNNNSQDDPCIALMIHSTEEGHKVERNQGEKYYAVYERIPDTAAVAVHAENFFRGASI